jgi:ABC-2 type transport system ATP-binding protein
MIRVEHVIYDYPGHRALDDVSFALPPASVTALVGPNGAGKTTLLRNLAALDEPMSGNIVIGGLDVRKQARQAHRLMGYLPDHFGLYQDLSARRCLMYAAYARGLDEDAARAAAEWAARQVDLLPQLEMRAGTLSRGQRQRLALAQAIAHRPRVLLLDEPASGLDPQARAELSSLMKSLAADGMTLLISSHILVELESYCTAMLVLERGRLLAHQPLRDTASETNPALQQRVLRVRLAAHPDQAMEEIGALKTWAEARGLRARPADSEAALLLEGDFDDALQLQLLRELLEAKWKVLEFAGQTRNLQNVYLQAVSQREGKP